MIFASAGIGTSLPIALNQYSLIREHALAIHGNDIYVHERDPRMEEIALCASMAGYGNAD